jgi:Ribulose-5-phosphate 4-epimerase and related epimerases and aldolases
MTDNDGVAPREDQQTIDLVDANHILVNRGVLDAYGHVSVRNEKDHTQFYLARNMAPQLVTVDDIQVFDLEAETRDPRRTYLEKFIHSEVYKARPDVMAIVHSHSMSVVPFTIADRPLRAVSHMAGFLGGGTPVFEIRDTAGNGTDLLIGRKELGTALAKSLGDRWVVLMRGHGAVAVGHTLPMAVHRAVFTEMNARVQAQAIQLGECTYLTAEEAESALASNDGQITRAWDLWRMESRAI